MRYTNAHNRHFVCHLYSGKTFSIIIFFNQLKLLGCEKYKFTHLSVLLKQDHHEKESVQ